MSKSKDKNYGLNYNMGLKWRVMSHYSYAGGLAQCAHCGWHNLRDLEIDHINDNGREQRLQYCNGSHYFYGVLQREDFPDDWGLQVLCVKCHNAKPQPKKNGNLAHFTFSIDINYKVESIDARAQPLWEEQSA